MLTIPDRWGPCCISEPRLPFLSLPGTSAQLGDPVQVTDAIISQGSYVSEATITNAASIAALVLTTETLVVDKPEKKGAGGAGMPGMDGMGGMDY
jgi:chaperonin GroEL